MNSKKTSLDYIFYVDLIDDKNAPHKTYDELTETIESLYNDCNNESISIKKQAPLSRLHYDSQRNCKRCSMWIKFSKPIQEEPDKNDEKNHSITIASKLTSTLNDKDYYIKIQNITPVEVSYRGWCE